MRTVRMIVGTIYLCTGSAKTTREDDLELIQSGSEDSDFDSWD